MNMPMDGDVGRAALSGSSAMRPRLSRSSVVEVTGLRLALERARRDADAGRIEAAGRALDQILADLDRLRRSGTEETAESGDLAVIEASAVSLRAQVSDVPGRSSTGEVGALERALNVLRLATGSRDVTVNTWADYGAVLDILGMKGEAERALRQALDLGDTSREAHHRLARIMLATGRPEEAESILRSIPTSDTDDATTLRLLGDSLWARLDPGAYDAYLAAAQALLASRRLDETVEVATLAIRTVPSRVEARFVLGDALRLLNRNEQALEVIGGVLELSPAHPTALTAKADILRITGDFQGAVEALDAVLADFPEDSFALGMKADVLRAQGDYVAALPLLDKAIQLVPDDAWNIGTRGQVLRGLSRYDDAREDLLAALHLSDEMPWVRAEMAALELDVGNSAAARDQAAQALSRDPKHPLALAVMGYVQEQAGEYSAAESTFQDLVLAVPDEAWAWIRLAAVQATTGQSQSALTSAQQAIALDPSDEDAARLAVELLLRSNDNDGALRLLEVFRVRQNPPPWAMSAAGAALRQLGELNAATDELRDALNAWPDDPVLHLELARTLDARDIRVDALEQYRAALRLDRSNDLVIRRELADLEFRLGQFDDAARTLDLDSASITDWTPEDLIVRGESLRRAGKASEARTCFLRALELDAGRVDAMTGLLYVYLDLGKPVQARVYADRVLEGWADDPALLADVALVDAAEKKYDAALERTATALRLDPKNDWVQLVRGQILNLVGEWSAAVAVLQPLTHSDPSASTLSEFGWAAENAAVREVADAVPSGPPRLHDAARQLLAAAHAAYAGALDQDPADAWYRRGLADTLSLEGAVDEGRGHYRSIVEQMSAAPVNGANDLGLLAWCHYALGNTGDAVSLFINAVASDTADTEYLHFDLGLAMLASGQPDLGRLSYRRGLDVLVGSDHRHSLVAALIARNDLVSAQLLEKVPYEASIEILALLNERIDQLSSDRQSGVGRPLDAAPRE